MSGGGEDDEFYSDATSNSTASDMLSKIAMFEKSGGTSAPKPKLTQKTTQNGVGPKPPTKSLPVQQASDRGTSPTAPPPKTTKLSTKPNSEPVAVSPKNRADEGPSVVKGAPSSVRLPVFQQTDRNPKESVKKPRQSPVTPENPNENGTLYPPAKGVSNGQKAPKLPPGRSQGDNLFKANGKTYRRLPFVAPKGPAPSKPRKPPTAPTTLGSSTDEVEEIYEDASMFEKKPDNETLKADDSDEEDYEEVGAYSEVFRK